MAEYDFDIALLSEKEVKLLVSTPPNECSRCEWIINHGLYKTKENDWYISIEELDDADIEHLEQIIGRKLIDGITDAVILNNRYTNNQC